MTSLPCFTCITCILFTCILQTLPIYKRVLYSPKIAILCLKGYLFIKSIRNCLFYRCNLLFDMSHTLTSLNNVVFMPSEDTSHPSHAPSLIRVFAVFTKKA